MIPATIILMLLGLSLGSFLNVCLYRIPRGLSLASPGSFCPICTHPLGWRELVPIISFAAQQGKCKHCSSHISWRYPVVELVSGCLVVGAFLKFELTAQFAVTAFFLLLMLLVSLVDWEHLRIPNSIVLFGIACGIVLTSLTEPSRLLTSFGGALFSAGVLAVIRYAGNAAYHKETMGIGDIKLAFVIGLFLGIGQFLLVVWCAAIFGGLYGAARKIIQGERLQSEKIPFGTFLSLAAGIILFFTESIQRVWLDLMQ